MDDVEKKIINYKNCIWNSIDRMHLSMTELNYIRENYIPASLVLTSEGFCKYHVSALIDIHDRNFNILAYSLFKDEISFTNFINYMILQIKTTAKLFSKTEEETLEKLNSFKSSLESISNSYCDIVSKARDKVSAQQDLVNFKMKDFPKHLVFTFDQMEELLVLFDCLFMSICNCFNENYLPRYTKSLLKDYVGKCVEKYEKQ